MWWYKYDDLPPIPLVRFRQLPFGLKIQETETMGRGVFSTGFIPKNTYVVEYPGKYLAEEESKQMYEKIGDTNYVMWLQITKNKWVCLDATEETSHPGRLINHSTKESHKNKKKIIKF